MPLAEKLGIRSLYVGTALILVALIVVGAFYAPAATEIASRWVVFAAASAFVFGYQIFDFWNQRKKLRFWAPLVSMFLCHFLFWVHYVRPHFGGDPRLFVGFILIFLEYVIVSVILKCFLHESDRSDL